MLHPIKPLALVLMTELLTYIKKRKSKLNILKN